MKDIHAFYKNKEVVGLKEKSIPIATMIIWLEPVVYLSHFVDMTMAGLVELRMYAWINQFIK